MPVHERSFTIAASVVPSVVASLVVGSGRLVVTRGRRVVATGAWTGFLVVVVVDLVDVVVDLVVDFVVGFVLVVVVTTSISFLSGAAGVLVFAIGCVR